MNANIKMSFITGAAIAGLIAGITGCIQLNVRVDKTSSPEPSGSTIADSADRGAVEKKHGDHKDVIEVIPPFANSGSLTVGVGAFSSGNGGQQCFPTAQGWDRYYPLPKLFLGPNTTPSAITYTNSDNLPSVTVSTCDPLNGPPLETGIVIAYEFAPSNKKCATNSGAACVVGPNLTINQRDTVQGIRYKATVFYKSATLGTNTSVKVNWSYP